jgi:hypothetical protein
MRGRPCDLLKVGVAIAGMLFLLALIRWVPVADAQAMTSGLAAPGTVAVQATPTEDATVTALNKEQLVHENDWWWNYGATVLTSLISTLTLAAAGIFAVVRYFNDRRDAREAQEAEAKRLAEDRKAERERRDEEQQRWLKDQEAEREKRAEERFQAAVEGLSSEREEAKIGAAILLRTFLRPGYEQFYIQVFDLAVAHLRLPRISRPTNGSATPLPLTTLRLALIVVFKEAFPLAREQNKGNPQSLDAIGVQLDNAYLTESDLKQVWMAQSSLRTAYLNRTNLSESRLRQCDLRGTNFRRSILRYADFSNADLSQAKLENADLTGADLTDTNLSGTDLRGVVGLTKEQLEACKAKGAIIDEEPATAPTQSASTPPAPNDETQVLSPRPVKWKHRPSGQKNDV